MKRARLTKVPITKTSSGADLTDRLLDDSPPPAAGKKLVAPPPARKAPKSAAKKKQSRTPRKRAAVQSQADLVTPSPAKAAAADLPRYTPYRTVEPAPARPPGPALERARPAAPPAEMPKELRAALSATEKALGALVAAAEAAPARHNLAIRYRLDALRHHLRQVAEFLAANTGS